MAALAGCAPRTHLEVRSLAVLPAALPSAPGRDERSRVRSLRFSPTPSQPRPAVTNAVSCARLRCSPTPGQPRPAVTNPSVALACGARRRLASLALGGET